MNISTLINNIPGTIKQWSYGLGALFLTSTLITLLYINHELRFMYGSHTPLVDTSEFVIDAELTAITGAQVLSADGEQMLDEVTVVFNGNGIIDIGTSIEIPTNAKVIDASGKFLIPGLIDSHVHLWESPNDLLLYLANGVTHIREMGGISQHLELRAEVEAGRPGPRIFVSSPKIGSFGLFEGWFNALTRPSVNVRKPEHALAVVSELKTKGYDGLKLGTFLGQEHYAQVNAAAKQIGLPSVGHLPVSMPLSDLKTSGQHELAHVEEIVKPLLRELGSFREHGGEKFLQLVNARADDIIDDLLANDIAVTSTLMLMHSFVQQKFDLEHHLKQSAIEYVNAGVLESSALSGRGWLVGSNLYQLSSQTAADKLPLIKDYWSSYAKASEVLLKRMADRGVTIMAGTDANVPVAVPGFSLHEELASLQQAGLSSSHTLRTATQVPADWMNSNAGKIAVGARADLVLLDNNPLEDIQHTRSINTVISNGRVYSRNTLDSMLAAVKAANDKKRNADIYQTLNHKH